jgi:hypothetical protein
MNPIRTSDVARVPSIRPLRGLAPLVFLALAACGGSTTSSDPTAGDDASTTDTTPPGDDGSTLPDTNAGGDTLTPADTPPPPAADYTQAGSHTVAKKDATVSSNSVHCLFPSDAPPAAGFPGVAFAHGFQLATTDYDQILSHVASWGYVVCSTNYPGSILSTDHRDVATALTNVRTAMAAGTIAGVPKVDGAHIAAAGHSLGGKGTVMAMLADPAFVAAVTFDPVDGNPGNPLGGSPDAAHPKLNPTETAKLTKPMGYFGATQSHCGSTACAPTGLDAAAFFAGTPATTPKYLWTVWDFGHMQFLDNPNCGFTCSACSAGKSAVDPRKVAIKSTAVAFLERYLRSDVGAQSYLDGAKRDANVAAKNFWDGKTTLPACN